MPSALKRTRLCPARAPSFAASCFDNYKVLKFNPLHKCYAMFSKYFVGTTYQSLIRNVFTIPGEFAAPDV